MPLITTSDFKPSLLFRQKHISTIAPSFFRKVKGVNYNRKRISTPDDDFLDLDFSIVGSDVIVIISHGLEGNSERTYMKGMVKAINKAGWDAVALNLRGCSGEPNNLYLSYHSGKTDDLDLVINHLLKNYNYQNIKLVGYSLGGNLTLKYIGEKGEAIPPEITSAVAISVPVDLKDSANQLSKTSNAIYMKRFLNMLKPKLAEKAQRFTNNGVKNESIFKMRNFSDFDNLYTAPAHGFSSAEDYWEKCSAKFFLSRIKIPTLLINALNDPFLGDLSYPIAEAQVNQYFYIETPNYGGHVGFVKSLKMNGELWIEKRTIGFLNSQQGISNKE
jgi:predicted alpha/beta-fold hydrolase